ncbi:OmpA family protein [Nocardiopsis suaedae]|uniref:OmpA family protein n=1 Tax=Nocardiopsis suaedae TaxID=3018444 RepID=A0ABT4TRH1_9ACTN|nr:OmpA family protein [Nocardiopsis suaedae]MDA2807273.1 OmpA family protein [Nocardiopsis suaedae]
MPSYLPPSFSRLGGPGKFGIGLLCVTVLAAGCVSGGDSTEDSDDQGGKGGQSNGGKNVEGNEVFATTSTSSLKYGNSLSFGAYPVQRVQDGVLVMQMRATNQDSENDIRFSQILAGEGSNTTAAGLMLIDTQNAKAYEPLTSGSSEECVCSDWKGQEVLAPGDSVDFSVAFPSPPEDIDKVTIATFATPDIIDVPIIDGSVDDEIPSDLNDPSIVPLSAYQDEAGGEVSREEGSEETRIMLSSDVLFDLNESELTDGAAETLESVAKEIDESGATEVSIDGYTDSSGNDSINVPLSKERAETVLKELEDLVTTADVSFTAEGHGSEDPVGDNDTEEGRQKNRRVTVSFPK